MITRKSPIAMDDFEHRKAMQELAAMSQRNNVVKAEQALAKIQSWKEKAAIPETVKRIKLNPPALRTKSVVCNVKTGAAFKQYRIGLNIQPVQVYKLAGMSKEMFHDLERGNCKWTEARRRKIADAIYDIVAERQDKFIQPLAD